MEEEGRWRFFSLIATQKTKRGATANGPPGYGAVLRLAALGTAGARRSGERSGAGSVLAAASGCTRLI